MRGLRLFWGLFFSIFCADLVLAQTNYDYTDPDFYRNHPVMPGGNKNPFQLPPEQYEMAIQNGRLHAILYPVDNTKFLPPAEPVRRFLEEKSFNPLKMLFKTIVREVTNFKKTNGETQKHKETFATEIQICCFS